MSTGPDDENIGQEIGKARSTDYFVLRDQLGEQELDYLLRVREFVDARCCR
jgi:hypothetical protein